jgi:catechol 1,2-dioxygenase
MQDSPNSRRRWLLKAIAVTPFAIATGALAQTLTPGRAKARLIPTPKQVEGPYFLPNSPLTGRFIPQGMSGQEIHISGTVLDVDGNVIPNATVHVWVASPTGVYDNQDAAGRPRRIPLAQQTLRGRIITSAQGAYAFECLRPGNYELGGGMVRPAHIHVRVDAAGYQTLITQLYFVDDQFNTRDLPGDEFFQPELLVPLSPATPQAGQIQSGNYTFVLER